MGFLWHWGSWDPQRDQAFSGPQLSQPAPLFLASGCFSLLPSSFFVAVTTQAPTGEEALSLRINMLMGYMELGARAVACVTEEEFPPSYEISHWCSENARVNISLFFLLLPLVLAWASPFTQEVPSLTLLCPSVQPKASTEQKIRQVFPVQICPSSILF